MRAIVLGSNGFIGQNLVKGLIAFGHEVIALDNLSTGKRESIPPDIKFYNHDVNYRIDIEEDVDVVYYFAGPSSVIQFNKDPFNCVRTTLQGMANAIDLSRRKHAKLVYPSSGNIYGNGTDFVEWMEAEPNNLYGLCKKICERMAKNATDVKSTGFRIFLGYGPGEGHKGEISSAITLFLNDMKAGKSPVIWGDGTQARDPVYIDDIVTALIEAGTKDLKHTVYNLGTSLNYTFNDIVKVINDILKTDIKPVYVEKPKVYVEKTAADTTLFKSEFETIPRELREGLEDYIHSSL
jgi:UDP-glucose 4-epimerase